MMGLLSLYFIIVSVVVKCDMVHFSNDTISDVLYTAQMAFRPNCSLPQEGYIIVVVGENGEDHEQDGCTGTSNMPVDKIVVKHLIKQANDDDINISHQCMLYLFTEDKALTQGNTTWKNLTATQWSCLLPRRIVALLNRKGIDTEKALPPSVSLQKVLIAEYMQDEDESNENDRNKQLYNITPDVNVLITVVKYFILTNGWTRIGLLYDGTGISKKLTDEFKRNLTVYLLRYDGSNANELYNYFKNNNIRVIVFLGSVHNYLQVLDDLYDYYYTGVG